MRKTRRILDLGCGTGSFTYLFDKHVYCIGLDIELVALKTAKKYCIKSDFILASVFNLPFRDQMFDTIAMWGVMEQLQMGHEIQVVSEIFRILTPGGFLLLSAANNHILAKLMDPAFLLRGQRYYDAIKLTSLIEKIGFRIEKSTVRGGIYTLLAVSVFYFYKHILHKLDGKILRSLYPKIENEFYSKKEGISTLFIAAQKKKN
jgi:ubiquinone/menaquinone biosynthesis C-methylase UbiE